MKYIKPSFEEILLDNPYDFIALVGHNCYQVDRSNDNEAFVKRLINNRHLAMVEHYNFNAEISHELFNDLILENNKFIKLVCDKDKFYVSFTLRVLLETFDTNNVSPICKLISLLPSDIIALFDGYSKIDIDGKLMTEDEVNILSTKFYDVLKHVTIKMITDRGVTHEIVRHRLCSFAQESTRYCNYAKEKFGNELTFIEPIDYCDNKSSYDQTFSFLEKEYLAMIDKGVTPELARSILPNKLKASIIITANIAEWKSIFELRTSPRSHPDMREIMIPIKDYFVNKGYLR